MEADILFTISKIKKMKANPVLLKYVTEKANSMLSITQDMSAKAELLVAEVERPLIMLLMPLSMDLK
jgi:hypothetical protein